MCLTLAAGCALLAAAGGCSGKATYPVEGKVVLKGESGPAKDLAGYLVMFESAEQKVSATGTVQPDGTFRVGTFREGDGAVAGKHRVALTRPMEEEGKPRPKTVLPEQYQRFETSGLVAVIEPGTNEVTLEVERLKR